jgi:hypothetical protein
MKNKKLFIGLAAFVFVIVILACKFPGFNGFSVNVVPTSNPFPAGDSVMITPGTNPTTTTITEAQVNQIIRQSPQSQGQSIQDPQVDLQPGVAILYGNVQQNNLTLPLRVDITLSADGQGGIRYQVVSARLGPFPLPQSSQDEIAAQLGQVLDEQINILANNMYIDDIQIGDGFVLITGHSR